MVSHSGATALVLVDTSLRRIVLPLILTAAAVFRFNLFSFVYLLFLLVGDLIPSARIKSQRVIPLIFLGTLVGFSAVAALAQAFFQISIATGYTLTPCEGAESTWRQCGFVQFKGVLAEHVVRLLLPDVVVFLTSLLTLCFSAVVFVLHSKKEDEEEKEEGEERRGEHLRPVSASPSGSEPSSGERDHDELADMITDTPFPLDLQCYLRLPKASVYIFDAGIFFMLGLSGIVVPSLTSFTYYAAFLLLLVLWGLHLRLYGPIRLLRALLMLYSALHVLLLHLYQFPSLQSAVPVFSGANPREPLNTTDSLLARLFGLTPIIRTDCIINAPSTLTVWPGVEFTYYLNPFLLLFLFWFLATDLRLWIFTPSILWTEHHTYHLPVLDQEPSSSVVCVQKREGAVRVARYGSPIVGTTVDESPEAASSAAIDVDPSGNEKGVGEGERKKERVTFRGVCMKVWQMMVTLWNLAMSVNYTISIIVMMLWSVLYPSWPALVLLLWACAIWLIPRVTPRLSLYFTSPLLVIYSIGLLLLEYVQSLRLTENELPRVDGLGAECVGSTVPGCSVFVLLIKTAFATIFFASFHEFVTIAKRKWRKNHLRGTNTTDDSPDSDPEPTVDVRSAIYTSLNQLICTYWVLVVVGAFLLVTLTGNPNIFKAIYLICFFLFLCVYQISRGYWYKLCFIPWWILVVYASLELVLIYTFQFTTVSDAWERACNRTDVDCTELFTSIGLEKFEIGTFHSLFTSLVPPAIFIAVMAVQLRYFHPTRRVIAVGQGSSLSALDMTSLLPKFVRATLQEVRKDSNVLDADILDEELHGERGEEAVALQSLHIAASSSRSMRKQHSIATTLSTSHPQSRLHATYRFFVYLIVKTKQLILDLVHLCWRFLELHMHKIVTLTLFAVALSQISAAYWLLVLALLFVVPVPYLNPLTYPIITLYLGCVATAKVLYQIPLVRGNYTLFNDSSCEPGPENISGTTYNDSSRNGDVQWLGLDKTDDFARYIAGPVVSALLLSLWFSARRYQSSRFKQERILVKSHERGSLFLNVSRDQADESIFGAIKFLINHFYEMFGVEVCWTMIAITVAVRIDVYGVFYALALGVLLLVPRRFLPPAWFLYLVAHGLLLLAQYFFLLGVPLGFCFSQGGTKNYPWENLDSRLKKWLFLSNDVQLLDKNLLYVDFIVYLLVCLQMYYFHANILKGSWFQGSSELPEFLKAKVLVHYFKIFVFQYFFWVSLFLLFFTATSRVSVVGLIYLLLCFVFLYRGQEMLKDRRINRHRSWAFLRMVTWFLLLLRVSFQIMDCVFLNDIDHKAKCTLILVFNALCTKSGYYGSNPPNCTSTPGNIGLWVDALNFAVITLQIIIFDSKYSDAVRDELNRREETAGYFAEIFDRKVEMRQEEAKEKRRQDLEELQKRATELTVTEKKIDHLLYAGVKVPSDIELMPQRYKSKRKTSASSSHDDPLELSESVTLDDDPKPKPIRLDTNEDVGAIESEPELSRLARAWKTVSTTITELINQFTEWLNSTSALYREVTGEIKDMQSQPQATTSSLDSSSESTPLTEQHVDTYGTTGEASRSFSTSGGEEAGHPSSEAARPPIKRQVQAEVHGGEERKPVIKSSSYVAAIQGDYVLMEDQDGDETKRDEDGASSETVVRRKQLSDKDKSGNRKSVLFDDRGDLFMDALHIAPTEEDQEGLRVYETELGEKAEIYTYDLQKLAVAIYYACLSHSEFLVYFFVFLNVMLNGSILSIVYVFLLFTWGLLSIPWPSKKFWLALIFYAMAVLVIKYCFQFHEIDWNLSSPNSGLYPPRIIGILYRSNFFSNAVWDMLLLIALLFHRGLLKEAGLWKDSLNKDNFSNIFKQLWAELKRFGKRLISPEITQGAVDFYVPMLFFDILCFITIIFGFSSFGVGIEGQGVQQVAQFITTNYVPLPFVIMLLLQFLSMLVDRAIYLRHSLIMKVVFYAFLLVVWHAWLFFILPSHLVTNRPFTKNTAAQFIYFFKCIYFVISALQIVAGYPTRVLGNFLTKKYTLIPWLAFNVYRIIPLLPELREVMDWVFTDTSLSMLHWFRVQEIFVQLYLVKVRREREKNSPRDLGDPQSIIVKIVSGGLLVVLLVVLIWGPLLAISVINTTTQPNPPVSVSIQLGINGYQPLIVAEAQQQSINQLNSDGYNQLRDAFNGTAVFPVFTTEFSQQYFSRVVFKGQSTSLWTISPPARKQLQTDLQDLKDNGTNPVSLTFSWSITRAPSSGLAAEIVNGATVRSLTSSDSKTINGLLRSLGQDGANNGSVSLTNLFPVLIRAPSNGQSQNFSALATFLQQPHNNSNVSCNISLEATESSSENTSEWWTIRQDIMTSPYIINNSNITEGDIEILIFSDGIAPAIFSSIEGIGIIGLYVSVVLVIGGFIRNYFTQLPQKLIVDEIFNPDPLLKLYNDIILVREQKSFTLEEILVGKLFYIYRSPERLIRITEDVKIKQD